MSFFFLSLPAENEALSQETIVRQYIFHGLIRLSSLEHLKVKQFFYFLVLSGFVTLTLQSLHISYICKDRCTVFCLSTKQIPI